MKVLEPTASSSIRIMSRNIGILGGHRHECYEQPSKENRRKKMIGGWFLNLEPVYIRKKVKMYLMIRMRKDLARKTHLNRAVQMRNFIPRIWIRSEEKRFLEESWDLHWNFFPPPKPSENLLYCLTSRLFIPSPTFHCCLYLSSPIIVPPHILPCPPSILSSLPLCVFIFWSAKL